MTTPAKVAKIGRSHATEPVQKSAWRRNLRHLAKWMLYAIGAMLIASVWLMLIVLANKWTPHEKTIDCSLAEFHPDYSLQVREVCRKKAAHKL